MQGNRMFSLSAMMCSQPSQCFQTEDITEKETQLWHKRFGHLNFRGLNTLAQKQMVIRLPSLKTSTAVCTTCLIDKQHRETIPKSSTWRASAKLQLVYADICGPISPASNSHKRYILSLVDDYSRKTWVYFLYEKSEAFKVFKNFKACVKKESGTYIICLRTDRGGEFTSKEFTDFCTHHGISRQLTAAYTPQQNGVAKRKNNTIMNAVRAVLHEKQVPKSFWPEAVKWCVHVQNRSPTTAVSQCTPEEVWSGLKPRVDYFRIFGCVAHVHIPDQRRRKLDDKSHTSVLLGVSDETKAYKFFDPMTKTDIISRDVIFEEDKGWNWLKNADASLPLALDLERQDEEGKDDTEPLHEVASGSNSDSESHETVSDPASAASIPPVEGRATRTRRQPVWMTDYETNLFAEEENLLAMLTTSCGDPQTFEEANKSQKWREAMDTEMTAIERNNTWELVDPPEDVIPICVKWFFKTKLNERGQVEKYKARLVAKGMLRHMESTTQKFLLQLLDLTQLEYC